MKRPFLILALALVACVFCVQSATSREASSPSKQTHTFTTERTVLPNGLTVIAVENRKLPILQASLVVRVGAALDPSGKAGLANLTASLLDKGAGRRSATDIADEIDYTGGRLGASCGRITTRVTARVLTDHAATAFGLLRDMVTTPRFMEAEIVREKTRVLSDILRAREDPSQAVSVAFQDLVYEGTALRRPVHGYEKTLSAIERDDILSLYRDYYVPENSFLVIVADYSVDQMIDLAREYFGQWEREATQPPVIPSPRRAAGKKVRLVNMDINQSYIAFGHLGVKRSDPEYNAVRVMNYILGGGGFVSRITKSIRGRQGLAYSAYSYFVPGPQYPGFFRAGLQTKIESTSQALNSLLQEIGRIRSEPVTERELADAKSFYQGSLPRRQESYSQIAELFADQEVYGLVDDYWVKDLEEIRSLTVEDIQRVAGEYLSSEDYVIAIATKVDSLTLNVKGITEDVIERVVP